MEGGILRESLKAVVWKEMRLDSLSVLLTQSGIQVGKKACLL